MNQQERRADWSVVAAIALIALGVWFLLGNVVPDFARILRQFVRLLWPLALIVLGILLYLGAQRGNLAVAQIQGKRLYRSRRDRMMGGVLAGLGDFLGIDPTWLRIGYLLFGIITGLWPALVIYVIAMIVIPEEPVGGQVQPPAWPGAGEPQVTTPPSPSTGWPHTTGKETVQTPPPPEPPMQPEPPDSEPPGEHGPAEG